MRKIKLIVSDLHLGKGRTLPGGGTNLLEEFHYDEQFVEFLNYYTSGNFEDCEVELILNGDIFNFLQIDYRGHFLSVITESITVAKLEMIVKGHKRFFDGLKNFLKKPKNEITYVVGNHDQGMLWPDARAFLDKELGRPINYKNIVYYFDGVHVEHGHMHEIANRLDPKKFFLKKNVAEPILNLPLGSQFFVDFVLKVKHQNPFVDKVRPFQAFIRWGLIQDTIFTFMTLLKLLLYFVLRVFSAGDPRRQLHWKRVFEILVRGAVFPDLGIAAKKILNNEKIHTVIFGHSHVYQYRQFGEDKEYFNTGTWTELTSLDLQSLGKITKMTYVLIDYNFVDSERPRARLKEWRGYHRIEEDVDVSS